MGCLSYMTVSKLLCILFLIAVLTHKISVKYLGLRDLKVLTNTEFRFSSSAQYWVSRCKLHFSSILSLAVCVTNMKTQLCSSQHDKCLFCLDKQPQFLILHSYLQINFLFIPKKPCYTGTARIQKCSKCQTSAISFSSQIHWTREQQMIQHGLLRKLAN